MMGLLSGIVTLFSSLLILFNFFGGIFAVVWLGILREWGLIIQGSLFILFASWAVSFLLLPSLALVLPINYFVERKSAIGVAIFGFLNLSYTFAIIAGVSYYVFEFFLSSSPDIALLPVLVWAYTVATAPWTYMASKEGPDSTGSTTTVFFTELGLISVVILIEFFGQPLLRSFYIFGAIMLLPLLLNTSIAVSEFRSK